MHRTTTIAAAALAATILGAAPAQAATEQNCLSMDDDNVRVCHKMFYDPILGTSRERFKRTAYYVSKGADQLEDEGTALTIQYFVLERSNKERTEEYRRVDVKVKKVNGVIYHVFDFPNFKGKDIIGLSEVKIHLDGELDQDAPLNHLFGDFYGEHV